MANLLLNDLRSRIKVCTDYAANMQCIKESMTGLLEQNENYFTNRIQRGEMSLDEYVEFRKNFMFFEICRYDFQVHLSGLSSVAYLLELSLKQNGKSLADVLTYEETLIVNEAKKESFIQTGVVDGKLVFLSPEIEKEFNEKIKQESIEPFNEISKGKVQ